MQGAVWSLACVSIVLLSCSKDADPASETALGQGSGSTTTAAPNSNAPKAESPKAATEVIFETEQGEKRVTLEVVWTPAKIQRGLMYRKHLAPDHGMVFVFSGNRVRSFWMKNTLIPLDMLFVTEDFKVAGIVENTTPLSLESRSIGIPTHYVIEVNGGWTAKNGVTTGTSLRLENMPAIGKAPM